MEPKKLAAVVIDYDNIYVTLINQYDYSRSKARTKTVRIIGNLLTHMEESIGLSPIIRQAFADWSAYPDTLNELSIMGFRVMHVKGVAGKNSADIELSLSLQEVMLTRPDMDVLVVVAGDRDYLPIAQRVQERAKRIVFYSFEKSLSGDIKELVGKENYFYVDPETNDVFRKGEKKRSSAKPHAKPSPKLDYAQESAMRAALEADREYGPKFGSVKLSGFLVDRLAKALPEKSHLERKDIFSSLVDHGLIKLNTESDIHGMDFTVFKVELTHPLVKKLTSRTKKKARSGKTRS
jgi:uncharacterized LabA/DUF88 family protein